MTTNPLLRFAQVATLALAACSGEGSSTPTNTGAPTSFMPACRGFREDLNAVLSNPRMGNWNKELLMDTLTNAARWHYERTSGDTDGTWRFEALNERAHAIISQNTRPPSP